ncbi:MULTISPECIES: hypothetical protein [unclassified Streptomyces]|uniref:hypothetical protein n=1 Tax=unclassified Streptomyces TaxID=2593676 RepID=UPI0033A37093
MTDTRDEEPRHDQGWADDVIAASVAADHAQRALFAACYPVADLKMENALRRAEALRGAAMGLPHAACAESAGVPQNTLSQWLADDVAFATAMQAARAMFEHHHLNGPAINPLGLAVVLKAICDGRTTWDASAQIGMSRSAFQRWRRDNFRVDRLVTAAQGFRNSAARRRSEGTGRKFGYRLVRRDS